jgi:protein required for attachment to host cells
MVTKTEMIRIPHNAYVIVGDGGKALFLRNDGNGAALDLKTEQVFQNDNPPTREQGSSQPGRSFQSVGHSRSSVEQTDWHDIEEHQFARTVSDALDTLARDRDIPGFVIVAPPRTLADLRQAFSADLKHRIIAEIDKDLTGHPVKDIEKHLAAM